MTQINRYDKGKRSIYKILLYVCFLLILCFIIFVYIDYLKYDALISSAPFSTYIIIRGLEFILPSIILFVISILIKNKYKI